MTPDPEIDRERSLKSSTTDAYELLRYAAQAGRELPDVIYQTLVEAKAIVDEGRAMTWQQEAAFLKAYQDLAARLRPVTAASLRDTDDAYGRLSWIRRLLHRSRVSQAKRVSLQFSVLAVVTIIAIIVCEFGDQLARGVISNQAEAIRLGEENSRLRSSRAPIERQLHILAMSREADRGVLEGLQRQREELDAREESLSKRLTNVAEAALSGYRLLWAMVTSKPFEPDKNGLPLLIEPLTVSVSRFVLPLLYGLLGACAYILRSVIAEMHSRSFEVKRFQDFGTRVYLGMLSGITVQWLIVGGANQAGGLTPAVAAFAGGYSVEMIFSLVDRVIRAATEAVRPSAEREPRPTN